ncbi:unnamed protein product [Allacma fusca]|uniref:Uncharacterized protein n=1 Tax=Allacma fusca TaxID=39272 RepID=A0A8J2PF41_9HEXA|nr:unnamed protein product [Allacma fusca]
MTLTEDVTNAMLEVAMLAHDVSKVSLDSILFNNEIRKMREEGTDLFENARRMDSALQNNSYTGVPKHFIEDLQRQVELIRNNVISLREMLSVTKSYASKVENPTRFQCTYSSSEGHSSSLTLANSSSNLLKTPQRNVSTAAASTCSSSSCYCFDCKQGRLSINWTPVSGSVLSDYTAQSPFFVESSSSGSLNDCESLYPASNASYY